MPRSSKTPPHSLRAAFERDKEHMLERRHRSVEQAAECMNVPAHVLYKWLETGRMPASALPAWAHATGGDAVLRFLAAREHKLLVDIPRGRTIDAADTLSLQGVLNDAVGALLKFHAGQYTADETLAALTAGMEALAWQRANVERHAAPQLELDT